jgi:O-methyltransferase
MTERKASKEEVRAAYTLIRSQSPWRHEDSKFFHHRVLPFATFSPWLNDSDFLAIYERVKSYTMVDIYRCHELWTLAQQAAVVDGDILEVGVWRGGTGAILAAAIQPTGKKVYLADTFSGVVKAGANDTAYKGGEHSDTSLELVRELFDTLSLWNVEFLQGVFPDETNQFVRDGISLLHCDVDVYCSAKDVTEWSIPRLSIGSTLVFDDYGFFGCEGITQFCNELRGDASFRFIHNLNGHSIFIKIQ